MEYVVVIALPVVVLTWTYVAAGNDNQNTLTESVATSMRIAGLTVDTLNYTVNR